VLNSLVYNFVLMLTVVLERLLCIEIAGKALPIGTAEFRIDDRQTEFFQ
jgi:hypothetical protein